MLNYSPDLYVRRNAEEACQLCVQLTIPEGYQLNGMNLASSPHDEETPFTRSLVISLQPNADQAQPSRMSMELPICPNWQEHRQELKLTIVSVVQDQDQVLHEMRTPLRTLKEVRTGSSWFSWRNRRIDDPSRRIRRYPRPVFSDDDR
ncbi:MAG: hypothetical protein AAF399_03225 [Bacteroidota bacterium]